MGVSVSSRHSTAAIATSSEPPRKKYRPSREPHRLTHVLSERNIAPARLKWGKYSVFRRAGAKNVSWHPTTPHTGAVFLSPQLHPCPTGGTQLTLLGSISVQAVQNSPSTHKTPQNRPFSPAGRILYRTCDRATRAGRVLSRTCGEKVSVRRVLCRQRHGAVLGGRVLRRLGTTRISSCRPSTAHGHRSQALRRPPHLWGLVAD